MKNRKGQNEMSYKMEKFIEAFKSEEIEEFISSLTGDDIKNFLIEVNRSVRELEPDEGGIYKGDRMIVGECISPKRGIQEKYFDKMAMFLKSVNNKKDMATAMYYLINYLHLFKDGNGRTSRFVYEAIVAGDLINYNDEFFKHKKGQDTSRTGFCKSRGIKEITDAKSYSGYAVYQYLTSMDLLPEELKNIDLYCARTFLPCSDNDGVYISEKALDDGILTSEVRFG